LKRRIPSWTFYGLSIYIFLAVILVAMLAGLGGSITGRILIIIINWKGRLKKKKQQVVFVLICGLIVA
jgi:hypothetical protein